MALYDLNRDRLAQASRQFGITETYGSLEEICLSDLDAIALFTQHWLHAEQAIQAMRAGKHVYSAVPPAYAREPERTLELCDQLVQTVQRTGQIYMLGEATSFIPKPSSAGRRRKRAHLGSLSTQ